MVTAILTWLASYGVGALLKFASDALGNYFAQQNADANAKEVGQLKAANEINAKTMETQDAMDSVARPSDDAVADSLRTGKF